VSFADNALTAHSGRVGVAMTTLPKVDLRFRGLLPAVHGRRVRRELIAHQTHACVDRRGSLMLKDDIADRLRRRAST
jgi:hypothetical protein